MVVNKRTSPDGNTYGEPHSQRRQQMLAKYSKEIRKLYGHDSKTAVLSLGVIAAHVCIAVAVRRWPLWMLAVTAWLVGGTAYNNLTAALHECCHYLIFRRPVHNKWFALVINLPMVVPAAASFRKYHLEHHSDMGVKGVDVDLPTMLETHIVVGTAAKLLYTVCYMVLYSVRPLIVRPKAVDKEEIINAAVVLTFDALLVWMWGWRVLLYLALSVVLGGGLHPLAAHLIAEHYVFAEQQETYSYYGPANMLLYNVGYHNEHHDFPQIPGSSLHKLKTIAPEYYNGLVHHTSYTWVLWQFLTNPRLGPWSRITRTQRTGGPTGGLSPVMGPQHVGENKGEQCGSGFKGEQHTWGSKGGQGRGGGVQNVNAYATQGGVSYGQQHRGQQHHGQQHHGQQHVEQAEQYQGQCETLLTSSLSCDALQRQSSNMCSVGESVPVRRAVAPATHDG